MVSAHLVNIGPLDISHDVETWKEKQFDADGCIFTLYHYLHSLFHYSSTFVTAAAAAVVVVVVS
jgi:hypothetical protein